MAKATFYITLDEGAPRTALERLASAGWNEETHPIALASQVHMLRRDVELEHQDVRHFGDTLRRQVSDLGAAGPDFAVVSEEDPSSDLYNPSTMVRLMSTPNPGELIDKLMPHRPAPTPSSGDAADQKPTNSPGGDTTAAPPAPGPDCCSAEVLKQANAIFTNPSEVWKHADKTEAEDLAKDLLPRLYEERVAFSKRAEWLVAPEPVLLDLVCEKAELASAMLRVRTHTTDEDKQLRHEHVELKKKQVDMADKEVQLAGQAVEVAKETLAHMKKWKAIADHGIHVLYGTVIFSMVALGYLLTYLVPRGKVSDAAIPVIIFVLALFAISPAVLLLKERPLKGLDSWMPGGAAEPTTASAAGAATPAPTAAVDAPAGPSPPTPSNGTSPSAKTTTTTTTSA